MDKAQESKAPSKSPEAVADVAMPSVKEELSPADAAKLEVTVAAAATAITNPSSASEDALEQFRTSLLAMVGVSQHYSEAGEAKKTRWFRIPMRPADETCASLIAKYVSLWSVLERPENQRLSIQALIGLLMLQAGSTRAASKIFDEIEFQTSTPAALSYVIKGIRAILFLFAVLVLLIVMGPIYLDLISGNDETSSFGTALRPMDTELKNVAAASVAGMFGSVVSLLLRLSEFEATKGRSKMFLMLTGFSLPLVGTIFGAFVASLFSAKVVNISLGEGGFSIWAFVAIGFLAGFSERFSRTFVQLAETKLAGAELAPRVDIATETTLTETGRKIGVRRPRVRRTTGRGTRDGT